MQRRDERGSVTALVVVMVPTLLALAGLVVDGGLLLSARREGANVAHGAARIAAQEIDQSASRRTGEPVLDRPAAARAAHRYLTRHGWEGDVITTAERVRVTVTQRRSLVLLGSFGLAPRTVQASASARPVHGVTAAEN